MDLVTLSNALKSVFGTSQTTATNIPICAADGTPGGNISVANLASVLGGLRDVGTNIVTPSNVDNFLDGRCTHGAEFASGHGTGVIIAFKTQTWYLQADFTDNGVYYRIKRGTEWTDWYTLQKNIPSFYKDYSTFNALSTAIGNMFFMKTEVVDNGTTKTIPCGGMITLTCVPGTGNSCLIFPHYQSQTVDVIGGVNYNYLTWSKDAHDMDVTFTNSSSGRAFILYFDMKSH